MTPRDADVLVVGGGPAGARCAWRLARAGARVTLADAGRGVRGVELLSGRARRTLVADDCSAALPPGRDVASIVSLWGTPTPTERSTITNPYGAGQAVDRASFDDSLRRRASAAGVELLSRTTVESSVREHGVWRISMRCAAARFERRVREMVIATGRGADRILHRAHQRSLPDEVALMARAASAGNGDDAAMYVEAGPDGWWYSLPAHDGGRWIGWSTNATRARQHLAPPLLLARELASTQLIRARVEGPLSDVHGRRAGWIRWRECRGPGWLAIGDAAFAPDPLSGTGLDVALATADAAAAALNSGRDADDRVYAHWLTECAERHSTERARVRAMARLASTPRDSCR